MPQATTKRAYKRKRSKKTASTASLSTHDESMPKKKVRWDGDSQQDENGTQETHPESEPEEDAEEEEEEEASLENQTCLSITCHGGRLGAAYFDPIKYVMFVLEDTTDSAHFDLTKMVIDQAKPDILMVPSKADETFMTTCSDTMESIDGIFQIRPHREFVPEKGRSKLLSLSLISQLSFDGANSSYGDSRSESRSTISHNAYDFMNNRRSNDGDPIVQKRHASIRLANYGAENSPLCLSAIGALLDFLSRTGAAEELDHQGISGLDIRGIELLAMDQVMQINADALSSLQIFEDETHASVHSNKSKEGLSLFAVLDFTRTTQGRVLLRQWCLRPSLSISVITSRHDAVSCFLRSENLVPSDQMRTQLKGFRNIGRTLALLRQGKAGIKDWDRLLHFVYHSAMLMENVGDLSGSHDIPIIQKLHETIVLTKFKTMGDLINDTIDWEVSENERRVTVRQHIDEELDEWKRIYHGLDSLLSNIASRIKQFVPLGWTTSLNVLYFPQLGYLICVPIQPEWTQQSDFEAIEGWSFQFSSDDSVYFKNKEMLDLDEHIGDLDTSIADREIEIIHRLQLSALEYSVDVLLACDTSAELDCLLAFAAASRVNGYIRPVMTEDNVLDIKQGRHPLVEQCTATFVANDAYIVGGAGLGTSQELDFSNDQNEERTPSSIIILTGANACGKSVYLKQNALIPFMAQIGCFVPAESATLGIVDKIFTRLQTKESVSKIQSAFMIDLNQVSLALRNATSRSLLILDEFGKGTVSTGLFSAPTPAPAAFVGLLWTNSFGVVHSRFHRRRRSFHEIFTNDMLGRDLPIEYHHMQAMLSRGTDGEYIDLDEATETRTSTAAQSSSKGTVEIQYLYRVARGLSLNSHATKCALLYGVPRTVTDRAEYVSDLLVHHDLAQLLDEDMSHEEKSELEEAETICRRFLEWDLNADDEDVKGRLHSILGRDYDADV